MTVPKASPTLSIHIETDRKGPNGVPLVVFPSGTQPIVRATVVFDNPKDNTKGSDITIRFDATIETKLSEGTGVVMFSNRKGTLDGREWKMEVDSAKPGYIAQGIYTKPLEVTLKPYWPCSYEQLDHPAYGWVRYRFSAFVNTKSNGFFAQMTRMSAEQEFWAILPGRDVLASTIPREPPSPPLQPNEHRSTGAWTVEKGSIVLKQYSHYYGGDKDTVVETRIAEVAKVPLQTNWPTRENANEAWERVVYMAVPEFEKATASFASRYLSIRHKIKIDAVLRSSNSSKPLTWSHKCEQPIVRATVVFDNPKGDIKGSDVTIQFEATIENKVAAEKCSIVLTQYTHYYGESKESVIQSKDVVVAKVPLQADWPTLEHANEAWERIVYMAVPEFDKATASFIGRYLEVRHRVKIDAVLRSDSSSKPLTWSHKFDVNISGVEILPPSIDTVNANERLPEYSPGSNQVKTYTEKS
ncbi:hypothetical protein BGW42_007488 [Actinomortierella wolfii]|nr:hypothetical protein BGW42_007488 [Actinomortierella wolfii]